MRLPSPVPELPVRSVEASGAFYRHKMGFRVDWVYADDLAGISKDDARLFLRRRTDQDESHDRGVLVWLNLDSAVEVDELYEEWKRLGVPITDELGTTPWNLREFTAQDLDGNRFRVLYDFGSGSRPETDSPNA